MDRAELELVVGEESADSRLDAVIAELPEVGSRANAARMIERGQVTVDGETSRKSARVSPGQVIVIEVAQSHSTGEATEPAVPFEIVYEDASLLVVDKPAGLVVHPAPGNRTGTLSQALIGKAGGGDADRPGIVHRLDKETSGLLVVARDDETLRALQAALQAREVHREYTALVFGSPDAQSGTVDAPLGRDRRNPELIAVRNDSERAAITHFEVIEEIGPRTLLRVRLETGRTHQIRVHLAAIGLPVCGDPQYGPAGDLELDRQFLHASELSFHHPKSGELMVFASKLPVDLGSALDRARESR